MARARVAQDDAMPAGPPVAPWRIGIYSPGVNRDYYSLAKFLALGGVEVWVKLEVSSEDAAWASIGVAEQEYFSWLMSDEQIRLVEGEDFPAVDVLLYGAGHERIRKPDHLLAWIARAERVVAWNTTDQSGDVLRNLRSELATTIKHRRFLRRTHAVMMQEGAVALRPSALGRSTIRQPYYVHPMFVRDPGLRAAVFDTRPDTEASRPIRMIFSGNVEPDYRRRVLAEVGEAMAACPGVRVVPHYDKAAAARAADPDAQIVVWMVRTEDDPEWQQRRDVIPPHEWPAINRMCDFAFCPPGYAPKTHRVIESMLQGAIPILDCPEEYEIGLADGRNCIVVRGHDWVGAVQRALALSTSDVHRIRSEVLTLADTLLHYRNAPAVWSRLLGLSTSAPGASKAI